MIAGAFLAATLLAAALQDGNAPVEPFRIADNLYYVGSSDIGAYLITTPAGHILIDAGYASTAPLIRFSPSSLSTSIECLRATGTMREGRSAISPR